MMPADVRMRHAVRKFMKDGFFKEMWGGGIYKDNLEKAVKLFAPSVKKGEEFGRLTEDIVLSYIMYGATPSEYFLLGFPYLNKNERRNFLTDKLKDVECLKTMTYDEFNEQLTNKYNFYIKNERFFCRKTYLLDKSSDYATIVEFIESNKTVFFKPICGSYGTGAFKYTFKNHSSLISLLREIQETGDWIIEELIVQSDEMSRWNPSSVNTVRIPSIYSEGKYNILGPFFRTGRKGAVVDNGGAGGVFAAVNELNGEIISEGCDENGNTYSYHPDSGLLFKGQILPDWDKLIKLSEQVHSNMTGHKYIAMDFAYTDSGWVLIEGNWGQFLWQYATKKGLKDRFLYLMSR